MKVREEVPAIYVINANIEDDATPHELAKYVSQHNPHVVVLQQANRARDFLSKIEGYRHYQYGREDGLEATRNAVLLRDDVELIKEFPLRMKEPWRGPKAGILHNPRVDRAFTIKAGKHFAYFIAAHYPPGGPSGGRNMKGFNKKAWAEAAFRSSLYASFRPKGLLFVVGDLNATRFELRHLVRAIGGRILSGGKVDHMIVRNAKWASRTRLKPARGCHGWAIYRIGV